MMELNARALKTKAITQVAESFLKDLNLAPTTTPARPKDLRGIPWMKLLQRTWEHLQLTFLAVFLGTLISVPLAILIHRYRRLVSPVLGFVGLLQTIPSIALLSFMIPLFGIGFVPALVGLFSVFAIADFTQHLLPRSTALTRNWC